MAYFLAVQGGGCVLAGADYALAVCEGLFADLIIQHPVQILRIFPLVLQNPLILLPVPLQLDLPLVLIDESFPIELAVRLAVVYTSL